MLDNIIEGLFDTMMRFAFNQVGAIFDFFNTIVSSNFGYNVTEFFKSFPMITKAYDIFVFTGIGLAVVFAVFAIYKMLFAPLNETKDSPFSVVGRIGLFAILMWQGYNILTKVCFGVLTLPLNAMSSIDTNPNEKSFSEIFSSSFLPSDGRSITEPPLVIDTGVVPVLSAFFTNLIIIICLIVVAVKFVKLFIELIERYCLMNVLIFTSPLIYSTVVTNSTGKIFSSWCRMFGGQLILILLNSFTMKMFISAFYALGEKIASSSLATFESVTVTVSGFAMMIAFLNIAQRFDTYLNQIGINAGITGGHFMGEAGMVINNAVNYAKMGKKAIGTRAILGSNGKVQAGTGLRGAFERMNNKDKSLSSADIKDYANNTPFNPTSKKGYGPVADIAKSQQIKDLRVKRMEEDAKRAEQKSNKNPSAGSIDGNMSSGKATKNTTSNDTTNPSKSSKGIETTNSFQRQGENVSKSESSISIPRSSTLQSGSTIDNAPLSVSAQHIETPDITASQQAKNQKAQAAIDEGNKDGRQSKI